MYIPNDIFIYQADHTTTMISPGNSLFDETWYYFGLMKNMENCYYNDININKKLRLSNICS